MPPLKEMKLKRLTRKESSLARGVAAAARIICSRTEMKMDHRSVKLLYESSLPSGQSMNFVFRRPKGSRNRNRSRSLASLGFSII